MAEGACDASHVPSLPFFLTLPPFPLRPSGGACAGAPRPLPGVVAHGRGCVRRQPRPFPSFLSDFLPSLPVLLGVRCIPRCFFAQQLNA